MQTHNIQKIVIIGGGTAGWMTAAALSHKYADLTCDITLIESDDIGTVGVGEATLPHLRFFNQHLGIDEQDFMRATKATYKMGIELVDWGQIGESYLHPFGDYGHKIQGVDFHQHWLKQRTLGMKASLDEYSFAVVAALSNKFEFPAKDEHSLHSTFSYAYHIDAGLYAKYLRTYSEKKGLKRIEGKVKHVSKNKNSGFIESVTLEDQKVVEGQLFIDCSGFRGLLIEQTLKVGYQDWSDYLPCNSAIAIACERTETLIPYSRATAQQAGWQWRIPLQHRIGNGYVYSSDFIDDQDAQNTLLSQLEGKMLGEPKQLRFTTGKRNRVWEKNCIAIGLSSGFLEPLESTGIYLIQDSIDKMLELFPDVSFSSSVIDEYNRRVTNEYERIRDFLILHYHATKRDDSRFWEYCRNMPIPDSLQHKIALFREQGHIPPSHEGLFAKPSWLAVYIGQGIIPKTYHPKTDQQNTEQIRQIFEQLRGDIKDSVQSMALHENTLNAYLDSASNTMNHSRAAFSLYGARR